MDAKKQNRIILGNGVIFIAFIWIGYAIFGMALGKTTMSMEGAYVMATFMVVAMMVGTWVRMPAVTFETAIDLLKQRGMDKPAFETPTFKTHAGNALWSIYRAMGNIHPDVFAIWVVSHLEGAEKGEFSDFPELENYLFSDAVRTYTHSSIGEGDIQCFVLSFWERQSDGTKKWIRLYVTEKIGEIFYQEGTSEARHDSMTPTDNPMFINGRLEQFLSPKKKC